MLRFVLRRLASGVALIVVIASATFLLLYAAGGNIARRILGQQASEETVVQKTHELGLDRPLWSRFSDWASGAIHGDLGASWFTSQPVAQAITSRLEVTLQVVTGATLVSGTVAVLLGVLAATRRGRVDRLVQTLSMLGLAIPNFIVALVLVTVLAIKLELFAPTGYVDLRDDPAGWVSTVTLPIIALSLGSIAGVSQQVRGSVIDALGRDYVRTLRSRGLSERSVVYKHVLRNAGGPALAMLTVQFVGLLGGAVIIEQVFAIPGLGQVSVEATSQGDVPLVMGLVLSTAILVVVVNLAVDLLQGFLNPKVRLS